MGKNECPNCASWNTIKKGFNGLRTRQLLKCNDCSKKFSRPLNFIQENCPYCNNDKFIVCKVGSQTIRILYLLSCSKCGRSYEIASRHNPKHNEFLKIESIIDGYERYLKARNLRHDFHEFNRENREEILQRIMSKNKHIVDVVVFLQKTHESPGKGRILYIVAKTYYHEKFFFHKHEHRIIRTFFKYLRSLKSYRLIVYNEEDFTHFIPGRCSFYKIKLLNWKTKSAKFKGIVDLKEEISRTYVNVERRMNHFVDKYQLIPTIRNSTDNFQKIHGKIEYLKKHKGMNKEQIALIAAEEVIEGFTEHVLSSIRILFDLHYLLMLSDIT